MFYIVLFTAVILSILAFIVTDKKQFLVSKISTIVYGLLAIFALYLFSIWYTYDYGIFFTKYVLNFNTYANINTVLILLILVLAFLISWNAFYYFKKEIEHKAISLSKLKEYNIFVNLFVFAMLLVASTNNILVMWIGLEATTIFTTFLISFYGVKTSWEAAWKYIILCSVGLTVGLFGILMLIGSWLESLNFNHIVFSHVNILLAKLSFAFILVGFGTKVGLFPMNSWLPDAHGKASTPVSAFMSAILLPLALYIIFKLKIIIDTLIWNSYFTNNILLWFGIVTLLYSGFILINQKHFKRTLAYSSTENMWILALALWIWSPIALKLWILHLIAHSFLKTSSFMSVGNVLLEQKTGQFSKISNLLKNQKVSSIFVIISILMLIWVPISPLFISEIGLVYALFEKNMWLSFVVIFSFILIFSWVIINFSKLFKTKEGTDTKMINEKFSCNSIFAPILFTLVLWIASIVSVLFIF